MLISYSLYYKYTCILLVLYMQQIADTYKFYNSFSCAQTTEIWLCIIFIIRRLILLMMLPTRLEGTVCHVDRSQNNLATPCLWTYSQKCTGSEHFPCQEGTEISTSRSIGTVTLLGLVSHSHSLRVNLRLPRGALIPMKCLTFTF